MITFHAFSQILEEEKSGNNELEKLKSLEKKILSDMKWVTDPMGRVLGINKKGYDDLKSKLDDVRKKISNYESKGKVPSWIKKVI